ncbi:hypothetical protein [Variovorax ginsengisoli]|uniref:Uncharacterized protein n=1 Tax=Variovorax ginsengisoli TaxID=363844 RepID=A0ABT8RYN6_9BURK|nr:hypothetical protein [Variovorax ginsengisoli]MDN8612355.1 hypothetical protein [Variovorax ginsengisoli]MDO1531525.1 hypothetical protein [Variovorax ginsengisoli]
MAAWLDALLDRLDIDVVLLFGDCRKELGNTYWHMAWWAFLYFSIGSLGKPWFPRYAHHRRLALTEAWPWRRSGWRELKYRAAAKSRNPWCATDWGEWLDRSPPRPEKGLATP